MTTADAVRIAKADDRGLISIGISDMAVTSDASAKLVTYALGSCIGVTLYDPVERIGGMLHFMLPHAKTNEAKAADKPGMFGDVGIPLLFRSMYDLGAKKDRLIVCAAGGAEVMEDNGQFRIGTRNRTILRKLFWKNNVLLAAEDTGGTMSRTMTMNLADGTVTIRSKGKETTIWPL